MKKLFLLVAFFTVSAILFAQPDDVEKISLTVEQAVAMAQEKNNTIQRGKITLDASERAKNHSWNSISPTANVSGGLTIPDGIGDSGNPSDYTANIKGTVSLSFSPNLFATIETARIDYEQGKLTYEQTCRTVELNVRKAFYGLLYEQENINLQRRNLQTAKEQYEQNLAKYNQGRMSELDVLSAEVKYKGLQPTVESAYVTFLNDLDAFMQLIGMEKRYFIEFSGTLDDVSVDKKISLENLEINSPSIVSLEKQLESAKTALLALRFSAYAPSVSASWQHGYSTTPSKSSDWSDNGTISLTATIPLDGILPWSTRADNINSAKDKIADLELQISEEKKSLKVNTDGAVRKIRQSLSSIKSKQANVELAQRTYDMTLQAYNRGTKDLLSLQNASDSLLSAEVTLKSEQRSLINAVLELENTIGVPFGTLSKK